MLKKKRKDHRILGKIKKCLQKLCEVWKYWKDVEVADVEFEAFEKFKKEYLEKFYK